MSTLGRSQKCVVNYKHPDLFSRLKSLFYTKITFFMVNMSLNIKLFYNFALLTTTYHYVYHKYEIRGARDKAYQH